MSDARGVRWPSGTDYASALTRPDLSVVEPSLRGLRFVEGLYGMPASASGQHAIVFHATLDERPLALRCSTAPARAAASRYAALGGHLAEHPVPAMAAFVWHEACVRIDERDWPALEMEWIEGVTLDRWLRSHASDAASLSDAASRWRALCADLRASRVTHGDLQHGNVLVAADGALRLVDFDGVWVPALADRPSDEVGHPNYQHPQRATTMYWGEHVDAFSALVVYVSLLAVAADPGVWDDHHVGDALVLRSDDFVDPTRPVWARLASSPDPAVVQGAARLLEVAAHPVHVPTDLEALLADVPAPVPVTAPGATPDRRVDRRVEGHAPGPVDEVAPSGPSEVALDRPGGGSPPDAGAPGASSATPRRLLLAVGAVAVALAVFAVGTFLRARDANDRADEAERELESAQESLERLREELGLTREDASDLGAQVDDLAARISELEGATEVDVGEVLRSSIDGTWQLRATPSQCEGLNDCETIGGFQTDVRFECAEGSCRIVADFLRAGGIELGFNPQRLRWEGSGRSSQESGFTCEGESFETQGVVTVAVDELTFADGSWRPGRLSGSYVKNHDPEWPCEPATIRYSITGTR